MMLLPVGLEPNSSVFHKASLATGLVLFHHLLTPLLCQSQALFIGGHLHDLLLFLALLFVESPFHSLLTLNPSPAPPLRHSLTSPIPGYCTFLHL